MSYFCESCGKNHEGFPDYAFAYPQEYLTLSDEDKQRKIKRISENVISIENDERVHIYVHVIWPQKVQQTDMDWIFKVWVRIKPFELKRMYTLKDKVFFRGTLQSEFPWYGDQVLGYPLQFEYDQGLDEMVVQSIMPGKNQLFDDFREGLEMDLALDWVHTLLKNVINHDGNFQSEIK